MAEKRRLMDIDTNHLNGIKIENYGKIFLSLFQ
jgi:hypothetical protein